MSSGFFPDCLQSSLGPWGAWRADSCPPRTGQLAIVARGQESECCGCLWAAGADSRAILHSGFARQASSGPSGQRPTQPPRREGHLVPSPVLSKAVMSGGGGGGPSAGRAGPASGWSHIGLWPPSSRAAPCHPGQGQAALPQPAHPRPFPAEPSLSPPQSVAPQPRCPLISVPSAQPEPPALPAWASPASPGKYRALLSPGRFLLGSAALHCVFLLPSFQPVSFEHLPYAWEMLICQFIQQHILCCLDRGLGIPLQAMQEKKALISR